MTMMVNVGGVKVTPQKIEKMKTCDDVSSALTIWEKIKKFFHIGNIEEKEKILTLIKDVFISNDVNIYQKVKKFEDIKNLVKNNEDKKYFTINLENNSPYLSIENHIKYCLKTNENIAEIEKIKNIQDNISLVKVCKNENFDSNAICEYLFLLISNKEEDHFFDELGGLNKDYIDSEELRKDLIEFIASDMRNKIKGNIINHSIFKEDVINTLNKKKINYQIEPNNLLNELNKAVRSDKERLQHNETAIDKITKTVVTDLPRMEFLISNEEVTDGNFDKIATLFKEESDEKKVLIYNLISQGVFQLVKDSFQADDPMITIGVSLLKGRSRINIDKDGDNINIKVFNQKTLETADRNGIKNASIFLSEYIDKGLSPYTQNHVNLLNFLINNLNEKPTNLNEILNIIEENEENNELLSIFTHMTMLEEETQLAFTYNSENKEIVIDKRNSYYEYSYLNS